MEKHAAVVGVFDDEFSAKRAISVLKKNGIEISQINKVDSAGNEQALDLEFSDVEDLRPIDAANGITKGASAGAIAGLIGFAVPGIGLGLGIATTIAGALGGGLIGGMAGIDEAVRSRDQPTLADYQDLLRKGKSILVVSGDETRRMTAQNCMRQAGAQSTTQHPPVLEAIHPKHKK
jgi:outer membrane lipoprotein SlyB